MSEDYLIIDGELWEVCQENTGGYQCELPDCGALVDYQLLALETEGRLYICEPCLLTLQSKEKR